MEYAELARAESDRGEVVLRERRDSDGHRVTELRVNGVFVMDTHETSSERELASRVLALVTDPRTVLVGGLGLGYTARELLADVRVERVDVVEIEEAVVGWLRDGTIPGGPELLADRRLNVITADVAMAVAETAGPTYDLMLLDVDNGPDHLVHLENAAVYERSFLGRAREIVQPDGVVAIWSASRSARLEANLGAVFGNAETMVCPVLLQDREEDYYLHLARVTG